MTRRPLIGSSGIGAAALACCAFFLFSTQPPPAQAAPDQAPASAVSAPRLELSPEAFLDLARAQLKAGRPALALELLDGILHSRPDFHAAKLIRIDALRQLGRTETARRAMRDTWRSAPNDIEKTRVARIAAVESYTSGRILSSKLWLRRALNSAPTSLEKQIIVRDYNDIRRFEPWKTRFSFSASPSSNVNNGAQGSVRAVDGVSGETSLDADNQALSGLRVYTAADARFRWRSKSGGTKYAGIALSQTWVTLSDSAKSVATITGSDLSHGTFDLLLGGSARTSNSTNLMWDFRVGSVYSGGAHYSNTARLDLTHAKKRANGAIWRNKFGLRYEDPVSAGKAARKALSFGTRYQKRLPSAGIWDLGLDAEVVFSDDDRAARRMVGGSAKFTPNKRVFGTKADLTLGARQTHYPDYWVPNPALLPIVFPQDVPGGRRDTSVFANARFLLVEQSYFGFAPEIRIELGKTFSNVSRFDTNVVSVGLGLQSTF